MASLFPGPVAVYGGDSRECSVKCQADEVASTEWFAWWVFQVHVYLLSIHFYPTRLKNEEALCQRVKQQTRETYQ